MKNTFTTVEGRTVAVVAVPWYRLAKIQEQVTTEFREAGRPLDVPTYKATTFTGEVEVHRHDAESVSTDDERRAWIEHVAAVEELETEQLSRRNKYILQRGIVMPAADLEAWAQEQRAAGYEPAEEEELRRWEYIRDLLKTDEDAVTAIVRITSLSLSPQVSEEAIRAAEDTFRRAIQGGASGRPAAGEERLADERADDGSPDGQGVGQVAERVRQLA